MAEDLRPHSITAFADALRSMGINDVDGYEARLRSNAAAPSTLADFAREGLVAATLQNAGCSVKMRDAPDLDVSHGPMRFYVEVMHFRRRREDDEDEQKLLGYRETGLLADHGDPATCAAQVAGKLVEKARKLPPGRPGVVALYTDSPHRIEQLEVYMAMSALNSDLASGAIGMGPFAGALCLGGGPPCAGPRRWGNVGFYPTTAASPALASETSTLLANITYRVSIADLLG